MKNELTLPKLRPEMKSAVLCAWLKQPGESFEKGEPLYEIETEKVVNQITAAESGIMGEQFAEEGDEVEVGAPLAQIEEEGAE